MHPVNGAARGSRSHTVTYLAWLDVRDAAIAAAAGACLREGLALSAGADFGDPGYLRINVACTRATLQGGAAPPERRAGLISCPA